VATHFAVKAPTSTAAGIAFTITVTALDAYGNTATGYRGTVRITSSDRSALLPAPYPFVKGDLGRHSFRVALKTPGSQSVSATDTTNNTITGKAFVTVKASPSLSTPHATLDPGFEDMLQAIPDDFFNGILFQLGRALPRKR
jgi:hypothetical protein